MDRRMYTRISLRQPIPCTCRIGSNEPQAAHIVNVSIMGAMLEVPDLEDLLMIECCQRVVVHENDCDDGHLFSGKSGTLNWVYKNYVGVCFDHSIMGSNMELRTWLCDHNQLCEEAS